MAGKSAETSTDEQTFGSLLRSLRESASLSQEELAGRAHLTVHAVSALERGLRTRPYPSTVRSLADALDITDVERSRLLAAVQHRSRPTTTSRRGSDAVRPAGLPTPPTSLVARESELADLTALLRTQENRLVTMTGTGGVGKTRLGVEAGHQLAPDFEGGVVFVPLAPVLDTELVLAAVADGIGVEGPAGGDSMAAVVDRLRDSRLLLVLDNFEHLLGASPRVAHLLEQCPRLTVLVTSRALLRIRGEREFPLQPLAVPSEADASADSVQASPAGALFLERAREVAPDVELSDADAAAVAGICSRLAGIPLALELAAARTRLLDPGALLSRLDDAVMLDGARDLPARQRTMRATLDWSFGLLSPREQALLRTLSVFSGGFTLEDAEAVAAGAGLIPRDQVLELVQSLTEQSLVVHTHDQGGHRRFTFLEPIAQYAQARLDQAGESEVVGAAHTAYYVALAERAEPEYQGSHQVEWLTRVDAEHANLTAAIARALASGDGDSAGRLGWSLWLFWWMRGHALHGRRQLEAALELPMDEQIRTRAEIAAATTAFRMGDLEAGRQWWESGLARARACGDRLSQANAIAGVGLATLAAGDTEAAAGHLAAALPLAESVGEEGEWIRALTHVWLGTVALLLGEPERAITSVEQGLASARRRGDRLSMYIALYNLSQVASSRGDHDGARGYLEEGLRLSVETGDLANLAYFCDALAVVEAAVGAYPRVPVLLGAAEGLRETVGHLTYGYYRPDEEAGHHAREEARTHVGPESFDDALHHGRAMDPDQAVAFAVGEA